MSRKYHKGRLKLSWAERMRSSGFKFAYIKFAEDRIEIFQNSKEPPKIFRVVPDVL
jgi:hypothetical protein